MGKRWWVHHGLNKQELIARYQAEYAELTDKKAA